MYSTYVALRCIKVFIFLSFFLSPLQPQCVLWCVCCRSPGPWSSTPEPVHSSDQDTYKWPPLPFSVDCCGGWACLNLPICAAYTLSITVYNRTGACRWLCLCDRYMFSVCRSVCWDLDSPFSCSSHGSLNNGSWESSVSLNAKASSQSSFYASIKGLIFNWLLVCVSGVHWLGATFWMVSQQTDIIRSTSRWRLFNLVLGAIHIFLFLNVKYGQSRCRMAGFYLVCVCVCSWSVYTYVPDFLRRAIDKNRNNQHTTFDTLKREKRCCIR